MKNINRIIIILLITLTFFIAAVFNFYLAYVGDSRTLIIQSNSTDIGETLNNEAVMSGTKVYIMEGNKVYISDNIDNTKLIELPLIDEQTLKIEKLSNYKEIRTRLFISYKKDLESNEAFVQAIKNDGVEVLDGYNGSALEGLKTQILSKFIILTLVLMLFEIILFINKVNKKSKEVAIKTSLGYSKLKLNKAYYKGSYIWNFIAFVLPLLTMVLLTINLSNIVENKTTLIFPVMLKVYLIMIILYLIEYITVTILFNIMNIKNLLKGKLIINFAMEANLIFMVFLKIILAFVFMFLAGMLIFGLKVNTAYNKVEGLENYYSINSGITDEFYQKTLEKNIAPEVAQEKISRYLIQNNQGMYIYYPYSYDNQHLKFEQKESIETYDEFTQQLLYANYNYLKYIQFEKLDEIDDSHNYLLIPDTYENIEELKGYMDKYLSNDDFLNFSHENYNYEIIKYNTDTKFFNFEIPWYDNMTTEKGYYQSPIIYVHSPKYDYTKLYTGTFVFNALMYEDIDGQELRNYFNSNNVQMSNETIEVMQHNKFEDLKYIKLVVNVILSAIILILIIAEVLYMILLTKIYNMYFEENSKEIVIKRMNGKSNSKVYLKLIAVDIIISLGCFTTVFVNSLSTIIYNGLTMSIIKWYIIFAIFNMVIINMVLFNINLMINEKKNILKVIKGGK